MKELATFNKDKPWNFTETHREAAKKIAERVSWADEVILWRAMVVIGTVGALVGPAKLLWAGAQVLRASWLWVQGARSVLVWWKRGLWGLMVTGFWWVVEKYSESMRWQRYGPGRTCDEWSVAARAWLAERSRYTKLKRERRVGRVYREWLKEFRRYFRE